jgi:hypothetical protein
MQTSYASLHWFRRTMGNSLTLALQVARLEEHCCAHADSTVDRSAEGGVAQPAAKVTSVKKIRHVPKRMVGF